MLERLLLYKDGRKLFPLHIPGREGGWVNGWVREDGGGTERCMVDMMDCKHTHTAKVGGWVRERGGRTELCIVDMMDCMYYSHAHSEGHAD